MKKETISISTHSRTDFISVSRGVQTIIEKWGVKEGLCTLYVPHTTAAVFINEGYDPDVMRDLETSLEHQVPWTVGYAHSEGNAAAHIKAVLIGNSRQILVENGRLLLGRWEEIFFAEFDGPRNRKLIVSFIEG
ncbi:MAG: YjbQ family protein [Candidatus Omnitrophota bacterium]|jgi:secondary thiamine-phosphate synthase enzyme|nr:MAG: YjbQ family protein [Candidatus Omnitrophota bacterium]